MRACVVIASYERPHALGQALASCGRQSRAPDELIVADDGSGPTVAQVVADFARDVRFPVRLVRQEHAGFRAGRMRNIAIAQTDCDYVILLDGDMVVHPHFVADHLRAARPGCWTQGVRIPLDASAPCRVLQTGQAPALWSRGLGLGRRAYAWHAPQFAGPLGRAANAVVSVKSCNQAFWRADLLRVNGFDEELTGWGSEDKELCARLRNAGVQRRTLLFAAIAWHLAHRPASRAAARANRERWHQTLYSGRTRCTRGIDQHLAV